MAFAISLLFLRGPTELYRLAVFIGGKPLHNKYLTISYPLESSDFLCRLLRERNSARAQESSCPRLDPVEIPSHRR